MFEEIVATIEEFHSHIGSVKRNAIYGGAFFYALALADSYNYLIQLADERTQQHPEVQRVQSLRTILLEHFYVHVYDHINLNRGTIFNENILGGPRTLREWQDAGYHTNRTASNYERRLRYWRAIYDNAPVTFESRVPSNENLFSTTEKVYQSSFARVSKAGKVSIPGKVNDRDGKQVTYEDVILNRDTRYGETIRFVPWWRSLNYGTGGQGYPASPALHFVEDAERAVPATLTKYAELFEQFMSDIFDDDLHEDDQLVVESWVKAHISPSKQYLPSVEIARQIAFGVPF